jgi:hypothetical protein
VQAKAFRKDFGAGVRFQDVDEQLEPERARSCRNAITMASVMIDDLRPMPARSNEPEP